MSWLWRKHMEPIPPKARVLRFSGGLLKQGQKHAGELAGKITTDGQRVDGEVSVTAGGSSWAAKLWAKVTASKITKPDVQAGVKFQKRWFGGW